MKLKYISIIVLVIGILVWIAIGVVKFTSKPTVLLPKANISTIKRAPTIPKQETSAANPASLSAQINPTKAPSLEQSKGNPKTLIIPKIKVNANIESIGLDASNRMEVPKNWFNVGWYNLGYPIGGSGSAVIDGHLDTVTGAPAAFYKIGAMEVGDIVTVLDDQGKSYNFKVIDKQSYDFDKLPLQQIFATAGTPGLNLITCAGSWDKGSHNYLKRLVVYTQMQ